MVVASDFNTPPLTDGDKKFYLYAKVSTTNQTGQFYISEKAIAIEEVTGYYHLLMGVLNSEFNGERSYVLSYEVFGGAAGQQVITNRVASANGKISWTSLIMRFASATTKPILTGTHRSPMFCRDEKCDGANRKFRGQTMIYFSGVDGSGQLAKGNITWDKYGNLKAHSGTFRECYHQRLSVPLFRMDISRLDGEGEGNNGPDIGTPKTITASLYRVKQEECIRHSQCPCG